MAGVYATKFDRLTVYSKELIPSSYSIKIQKEEWIKSLKLEENKILDDEE